MRIITLTWCVKNMNITGLVAIRGTNAAFLSLGGAKLLVVVWVSEPRWLPYQNKYVILERKFLMV